MKRNIVFLLIITCAIAGCRSNNSSTEYVEYADGAQYPVMVAPYEGAASVSQIKYSVPETGDLTLETRHHVIQIQGQPDTAYEYRVWAGGKNYADDPDLIVEDGNIMVLQEN